MTAPRFLPVARLSGAWPDRGFASPPRDGLPLSEKRSRVKQRQRARERQCRMRPSARGGHCVARRPTVRTRYLPLIERSSLLRRHHHRAHAGEALGWVP